MTYIPRSYRETLDKTPRAVSRVTVCRQVFTGRSLGANSAYCVFCELPLNESDLHTYALYLVRGRGTNMQSARWAHCTCVDRFLHTGVLVASCRSVTLSKGPMRGHGCCICRAKEKQTFLRIDVHSGALTICASCLHDVVNNKQDVLVAKRGRSLEIDKERQEKRRQKAQATKTFLQTLFADPRTKIRITSTNVVITNGASEYKVLFSNLQMCCPLLNKSGGFGAQGWPLYADILIQFTKEAIAHYLGEYIERVTLDPTFYQDFIGEAQFDLSLQDVYAIFCRVKFHRNLSIRSASVQIGKEEFKFERIFKAPSSLSALLLVHDDPEVAGMIGLRLSLEKALQQDVTTLENGVPPDKEGFDKESFLANVCRRFIYR